MQTPRITPVELTQDDIVGLAPTAAARFRNLRAFQVTRTGVFEGRSWREGDVVLCGGLAVPDATTVLVPAGLGRPMLGRITDHGLTGSAGEQCLPSRWNPLGRVLAIVPSPTLPQAMPAAQRRRAAREATQASTQLRLFAAAA